MVLVTWSPTMAALNGPLEYVLYQVRVRPNIILDISRMQNSNKHIQSNNDYGLNGLKKHIVLICTPTQAKIQCLLHVDAHAIVNKVCKRVVVCQYITTANANIFMTIDGSISAGGGELAQLVRTWGIHHGDMGTNPDHGYNISLCCNPFPCCV